MRPLLPAALLLALVVCTREQPMWLETAQQAQCSPKLLDLASQGVASLPRDRERLVNQALDAVAAQPDTLEGFERALELAYHSLRTLPEEREYFGVHSPTKDEFRNAVVLVLEAKALATGTAISASGDVEQAKELIVLCDGIELRRHSSQIGSSALTGLGPLAKPALRALPVDPRSEQAIRENREDEDPSE